MAADPVRRVPCMLLDWKFLGLGDADDGPGSVPFRYSIVVSPNASRSETDTKCYKKSPGVLTRESSRVGASDSTED